MIKSVKITDGYGAKLPNLKNRTFDFSEGVNVLFGPNGCGKTTLIGVLAAYCGINADQMLENGGWTCLPSKLKSGFFRSEGGFPHALSELAPGKCKAEVDWDGTPSVYQHSTMADMRRSYIGEGDGISDDMLEISLMTQKVSAGQQRLIRFRKLIESLKNPPDILKTAGKGDRDAEFVKYLKGLPRDGSLTVLLDEPDRSLSTPLSVEFWTQVMTVLTQHFKAQVIVASHSPFVLCQLGRANIIDVTPGYTAQSIAAIDVLDRIVEERCLQMSVEAKEAAGEAPYQKKAKPEKAAKPTKAKMAEAAAKVGKELREQTVVGKVTEVKNGKTRTTPVTVADIDRAKKMAKRPRGKR